jgi:hypothetical protein
MVITGLLKSGEANAVEVGVEVSARRSVMR